MASHTDTKRIAEVAMLTAMALAVQYMEALLPPPVPGVPVRIGLANIFVLYALLRGRKLDAALIALVRCMVFPLVAGSVSGLAYALTGSLLSYIGMAALLPQYQKARVSAVGVSVLGAFLFNVGQALVGWAVIGRAMWLYFPWMGLLSLPAGVCTGLAAGLLIRRLRV